MDRYDDEYSSLEKEARQEEHQMARQDMAQESYERAKLNDHLIKCEDCNGTGIPVYPLTRGVIREVKLCEGGGNDLYINLCRSHNSSLFPCCWSCEGKGKLLYSDRVAIDNDQGIHDEDERDKYGY